MKIRYVEAELFHAVGRTEGQTDKHDEANGSFSQICERASKNFPPHHVAYKQRRTRSTLARRQRFTRTNLLNL